MKFDIELLADKTMDMLGVEKGQVIWIWASDYSLDLIEALAYRIRANGAFWTLRFSSEKLLHRMGLNISEENFSMIPEHEIRWLADIAAIIEVRDHGGYIPDVPLPRRRAMGAEWITLIDEANKRNCRRISVLNPTPALATAYNTTLEMLNQLYWQAINIDDVVLLTWQERVRKTLMEGDAIHITSDLGTDLHLQIGLRPIYQDRINLPCGEVYVAPHEKSANGILVVDKLFIQGKLIERLRLTFTNGKVSNVEAPHLADANTFKEVLSSASGDKDTIAEFAIGLNPGVKEPIGIVLFDEKIGGSIHIAIGMNRQFGGNNLSNIHLDMVVRHPKIWIDETLILDNGLLKIGNESLKFL